MEEEVIVRAGVERSEKRNALDVVPMKMRKENVRMDGPVLVFLDQLLSQVSEPGAAVEDVNLPVDTDLNAGGIASVSQILQLGSGSGSSDAPEFHQHSVYPVATLAVRKLLRLQCCWCTKLT